MDYSNTTTVELSTPPRPASPRHRGGLWRELSGALAVGMSVLAVVVIVFQVLAWTRDVPGPGAWTVIGHVVAAALAVFVQRFADRLAGWAAAAAVVGVVVVSGLALWVFWWA
ncbi:hypothetical protein [Actinophytocola oryzae]|uniref:Uncharacterized protein n=1 Tax=Actinophytocola oryzae TaxID=502181 RepID=A0A4R7URU8_9PSEU|nr:hypothetical protein [Actinophytocola oryzae]TDV37609.1 hypothetical protein CLV71_12972 [Actinophytocola oryzae]